MITHKCNCALLSIILNAKKLENYNYVKKALRKKRKLGICNMTESDAFRKRLV